MLEAKDAMDARVRTAKKREAPPRRAGRPKSGDNASMRERILNAGERLFARHGFHGMTVREVAKAAGADPALAHYYFKSKQGLFDAVFERRAAVVNKARMESMERYVSDPGPGGPTAEGLIDAFLGPAMELWAKGGPGWKAYFRLVALVNNTPQWGGATMTKYFDPVIQRLIEGLRNIIPGAKDADLYWSYHFLSGGLTLTFAETGRLDRLSGGISHSADYEAVRTRMAAFYAAGFEAICRARR